MCRGGDAGSKKGCHAGDKDDSGETEIEPDTLHKYGNYLFSGSVVTVLYWQS